MRLCSGLITWVALGFLPVCPVTAEPPARGIDWSSAFHAARRELREIDPARGDQEMQSAWLKLRDGFPVPWDWLAQDAGKEAWKWLTSGDDPAIERRIIARALQEPGLDGVRWKEQCDALVANGVSGSDPAWLDLYGRICEQRRALRLRTVTNSAPRIVFIKRPTVRPSFFAYTEAQSDAQNERHFLPGAELCVLEVESAGSKVRTLVADPNGMIRDPAVSPDGSRIVFAWKKSLNEDDFHLYEYQVESGRVRQLTFGLGFADYEPAFLPGGDLIFSSSRCVQTVDCWWTEVSNLHRCNPDGRFLRRVSFDQVHAIYPQVMDDGRVIYTRWDYNDRGQIFPQPLFQMNMDGTGQMEFYGNSSWFPTTIAHARGIPGTAKVMAILCGHHTSQAGKLAIIDPAKGRQENSGVQLIAPVRHTPAERVDQYGQQGELWQYPFPLNEHECIVGFSPFGWNTGDRRRGDADFGLYWMHVDGRRELLVSDPRFPCSQPVPLMPRKMPDRQPGRVDYRQDRGTYYMRDIYAGDGLVGVPRGTVKKLRVVALSFRPAGIGYNTSSGPAGGALISTPIAIGNGSWDVKTVLGEVKVQADGSAYFTVPDRTPVYFQALDERGFAVQTMRTWSTLQPGETLGCTGCHDKQKSAAPAFAGNMPSLAVRAGPEHLPDPGANSGFSFPRQIQPILDKHCVRCHDQREPFLRQLQGSGLAIASARTIDQSGDDPHAFSLLGTNNHDVVAKRMWSDAYLALTEARQVRVAVFDGWQGNASGKMVNWISSQSGPEPLPPYSAGAAKSGLIEMLRAGHHHVKLSAAEVAELACWIDLLVPYCGSYDEANAWNQEEVKKFERFRLKRRAWEEIERENIRDLVAAGEN